MPFAPATYAPGGMQKNMQPFVRDSFLGMGLKQLHDPMERTSPAGPFAPQRTPFHPGCLPLAVAACFGLLSFLVLLAHNSLYNSPSQQLGPLAWIRTWEGYLDLQVLPPDGLLFLHSSLCSLDRTAQHWIWFLPFSGRLPTLQLDRSGHDPEDVLRFIQDHAARSSPLHCQRCRNLGEYEDPETMTWLPLFDELTELLPLSHSCLG